MARGFVLFFWVRKFDTDAAVKTIGLSGRKTLRYLVKLSSWMRETISGLSDIDDGEWVDQGDVRVLVICHGKHLCVGRRDWDELS